MSSRPRDISEFPLRTWTSTKSSSKLSTKISNLKPFTLVPTLKPSLSPISRDFDTLFDESHVTLANLADCFKKGSLFPDQANFILVVGFLPCFIHLYSASVSQVAPASMAQRGSLHLLYWFPV